MFIEPHIGVNRKRMGWIEAISGCMFSGKTEELIRRLNRALISNQKVEVFKPMIDNRYSNKAIVSHNSNSIESISVKNSSEILFKASKCEVVGIDEVQFFEEDIIEAINRLANEGKRVIVAGLDMDYRGQPFKPMDEILAIAEYVTKVHAVCMRCGSIATHTHRRIKGDKTIVIGEKDIYEALCRSCFSLANQ